MQKHQHQFTCPMHPEIIKDAPGKCPKCGMDLVPVLVHKDDKRHADHRAHQHAKRNMEIIQIMKDMQHVTNTPGIILKIS